MLLVQLNKGSWGGVQSAMPALSECKGGKSVDYYEVSGAENFLTTYGKGERNVKLEECKIRCSLDCKRVGFFYWEVESEC